jgi:hypothetical protein
MPTPPIATRSENAILAAQAALRTAAVKAVAHG